MNQVFIHRNCKFADWEGITVPNLVLFQGQEQVFQYILHHIIKRIKKHWDLCFDRAGLSYPNIFPVGPSSARATRLHPTLSALFTLYRNRMITAESGIQEALINHPISGRTFTSCILRADRYHYLRRGKIMALGAQLSR